MQYKMSGDSYFPQDEFIGRLKQDFPQVFTEGQIDPTKLQANLKGVMELGERYGLSWKGKSNVYSIIQSTITKTLHPVLEESVNFDDTKNLFIEGDNLDALKILQRSYYGKIKMIYIDPPYNTGNDFVYNDSFEQSKEEYDKESGKKNAGGYITSQTALQKNTKDSGHYHSNWLNMMYPRLYLARNLLRDDGVIFISIDDNEVHNLHLIMNEIFGEENCVALIPTIMNLKGNQDAFGFAETHEYFLVYGKNRGFLKIGTFNIDDEEIMRDWDEDEYGLYKEADNLRATGVNAPREKRPNLWYPIFIDEEKLDFYVTSDDMPKSTNHVKILPINPEGQELSWYWSKTTFNKNIHNLIIKNTTNGYQLYRKQRPKIGDLPTKKPKSFFYKADYSTSTATTKLKELLGEKLFDGPKPVPFVYDLVKIGTEISNGDIVLDFFAGSGTTANAVMDLNAEDGGNRKWICIQLDEKTEERSEAYKAGYATISDIAKERIRRAGTKIGKSDTGFKILKIGETNLKVWDSSIKDPKKLEKQMELMQDIIKDGVSEEELLLELIIKSGIEPTAKQKKADNYWKIGEDLIICLAKEMTESIWGSILEEKPKKLIFLDSSLAGNDQLKTNLILKAEKEKIEIVVV